jgi:D-arabinose 1-dehydrogenase-like Zn-dependent alcohol dehydrogenase
MDEIFKISKSPARAEALREMALERLADLKKEEKTYKIIEQYYEIIKELATAVMYLDGLKTLSHRALISYLEINHRNSFEKDEFFLMDELRKLRNNIVYYGERVEKTFLLNKESKIKTIIEKLIRLVK